MNCKNITRSLIAMAFLLTTCWNAAYSQAFTQTFADTTSFAATGWSLKNLSNPQGTTYWYKLGTVFAAHSGAADEFLSANFNNTGNNGTISDWLIGPNVTIKNGDVISFWTRTVDFPAFPDRLQLRMSTNGASTNVGATETSVGDFTTLLVDVNPSLTTSGYPNVWTQYSVTISGLGGPVSGRFAWRYFVTDAGLAGNNSDYIGVDDIAFTPSCAGPTITCPSTVSVNADPGACSATGVALGSPTTSTPCGLQSIGNNGSSSYPVGNTTVTWTVTDANGSTATCNQTVTVIDNQAPSVTCPSNISVNNDAGVCGAAVTFSASASDNCSATVSYSPASGSTFPIGTTTVTATATDGAGNTNTCSFTVTVTDNQLPVVTCPSNITVNNTAGQCSAVVTYSSSATDNCPGVSVVNTPASGSTFPVGTTTVTSVATDANGNTASCTFTVTVVDAEAPTINCPAPVTVNAAPGQCSAVVTFGTPATNDNCLTTTTTTLNATGLPTAIPDMSGAVAGTLTNSIVASGFGSNLGSGVSLQSVCLSINHTWVGDLQVMLTSPNGTTIQLINRPGTPPGTFGCSGDNIVACFIPGVGPGVESVCAGTTPTISGNFTAFNGADLNQLNNGGPANGTWQLFVRDSAGGDTGSLIAWSLNFASTTGVTTSQTGGLTSGSTFPVGTTTNTFMVTDAAGNTNTCSFTVTVTDAQPPLITCPSNMTINSTAGQCGATGTFTVTATDNCPGTVGIVSTPASGSTFPVGTTTVTSVATDVAGNTSSCTFTITVLDVEAPTLTCPANITVSNAAGQCSAVVNYTTPAANDNCNTTTTTTLNATGLPAAMPDAVGSVPGVLTRTIVASGFGSNLGALVNLTGVCFSLNHTWVGDLTINLISPNGTVMPLVARPGVPASTFGCGSDNMNVCFTAGVGPGVEGVCNGTSPAISGTYTAVNPNNLASLNNGGPANGNWQLVLIDSAAPDAGSLLTWSLTFAVTGGATTSQTAGLASGATFPVGTTTNTFVATDAAGNTSSCSFTVTVNDTQLPVITCGSNITASSDPGQCSAVVTYSATTASDNCPGVSVSQTAGLASGATYPVGTTTNTFVATDASGNTSSCSFTVTVSDNQAPVISCPSFNSNFNNTRASSDVPQDIFDNSTATSTLNVSGISGNITDINVLGLMASHTYVGDLSFDLTSPAGTTVTLLYQLCGGNANVNLNLDDEAAGPITCPLDAGNTETPQNPLSAFDGENPNGTWTLAATDHATFDEGTLDGWSLQIASSVPGAAVGSPGTELEFAL